MGINLTLVTGIGKYKTWKYELHQNLDNTCMALGERVCLNIAFLAAIRERETEIHIDININPLDFIDTELRRGVSESLVYIQLAAACLPTPSK